MYIVIYKKTLNFPMISKFEHLDEAQELVKDLVREGITDVSISKELSFRLKIEVEF